MSDVQTPETSHDVTIFAASWCPFCRKLIGDLEANGTPFAVIDPDSEEGQAKNANPWIESVNDGNRIIPTVRFSDGSSMTNPPASDVAKKLEELQG